MCYNIAMRQRTFWIGCGDIICEPVIFGDSIDGGGPAKAG
jgi:hypothetical protein